MAGFINEAKHGPSRSEQTMSAQWPWADHHGYEFSKEFLKWAQSVEYRPKGKRDKMYIFSQHNIYIHVKFRENTDG